MSATDFPSLCKDKNNLAKTFCVSCIFFANVVLFSVIYPLRIIFPTFLFIPHPILLAKLGNKKKKWKKRSDHFFHLIEIMQAKPANAQWG